jgi:hypothetical protein
VLFAFGLLLGAVLMAGGLAAQAQWDAWRYAAAARDRPTSALLAELDQHTLLEKADPEKEAAIRVWMRARRAERAFGAMLERFAELERTTRPAVPMVMPTQRDVDIDRARERSLRELRALLVELSRRTR